MSAQKSASPFTPMEHAVDNRRCSSSILHCICRPVAYLASRTSSQLHRAVCLSNRTRTFNPHTVQLSSSKPRQLSSSQASSQAMISTFPTSTREHYARVLHGDVPVHRNVQPNHESKGDATSIEVWLRTETRHLLSGVCFFLCLFQQNRTFTRIVLLCTRAVSCST